MTRPSVTTAQLESLVLELNKLAGTPVTQYTRVSGRLVESNAGNYHLNWAYGGVQLCQMCKGGGSRTISTDGFGTKRQCESFLRAFIMGISAVKLQPTLEL